MLEVEENSKPKLLLKCWRCRKYFEVVDDFYDAKDYPHYCSICLEKINPREAKEVE